MKAIEMKPIITTPSQYIVSIQGMEAILFDKMPDLSQSKSSGSKQQKLDPMEKEQSTWREKLYFDSENNCYLPGENIHESLKEGAKYWNQTIPGEGKKTYTDLVVSALVVENMGLNLKKEDERIVAFGKMCNMNPSKGKKSGSKAYVIRPLIRPWGGKFKMSVFDARLSIDVLKIIIAYAGTFKAVGTWRPTYGRFNLIDIKEV